MKMLFKNNICKFVRNIFFNIDIDRLISYWLISF